MQLVKLENNHISYNLELYNDMLKDKIITAVDDWENTNVYSVARFYFSDKYGMLCFTCKEDKLGRIASWHSFIIKPTKAQLVQELSINI